MYDIRQFRPALYLLLFLGMTGFSLAVESPGLWVLAVSVLGLHAWLVKTQRFKPFPRAIANLITLAASIYTVEAVRSTYPMIVTIGQFLVFLQLVKLFELRANRDYAQLLILSLLLMVAGAISTPSLAFGLLLIVHLFVSLYACLLFHLKVENEVALRAQTRTRGKLNEVTLKQDQRYLARSMRRLAALVSFAGISMAVFVFLFCPRGLGAGMFGQLQFQKPALTGFSQEVQLGDINRISQNDDIVAQVKVWKNDRLIEGTEPLLLRGRTFFRYDPEQRKWDRTPVARFRGDDQLLGGTEWNRGVAARATTGDLYHLKIALHPTGTDTLFVIPGLLSFSASRPINSFHFTDYDETLTFSDALAQRFDYDITARNQSLNTGATTFIDNRMNDIAPARPGGRFGGRGGRARSIAPEIADYARRPEVSGVDAKGQPLAALLANDPSLEPQIAANIEKHLRTTFSYTLDLTSEENDRKKDPVIQFLYTWKKGHCEYFASAMVLMCQSLGMQARMVTGFRSDEYDGSMGHYYVVRQSHAHAWVEVRIGDHWQTYDPTSGNEVDAAAQQSTWQSIKHFFDWLEFKWAENVVAYDGSRRDSLISKLDQNVVNALIRTRINPRESTGAIQRSWDALMRHVSDFFDGKILEFSEAMAVLLVLLAVFLVLCFLLFRQIRQRRQIRRRAAKIGLASLPSDEQIRLARQLGFYEQLTTLLERRKIIRPIHQTPAEFSDSLAFLPNEAFDTIGQLTRIFYSIRFGQRELKPEEQKELESTVQGLGHMLEGKSAM